MGALELRLLGGFELHRDGALVPVSSRKARALLSFLAATPGKQYGRERLAGLLWGDTGEERARHNLRQCVSTLRKTLGDDAGDILVTDGDLLSLAPDRVRIDVVAIDAARTTNATVEHLAAATNAYRGTFLAELELREDAFTEWLDDHRTRVRQVVCDQLSRLARLQRESGDVEAAIEALMRRIELDPPCEVAHRELIELYAQADRRSDALAQYERCRELLARHLCVEPGPETRQIARRLRANDSQCSTPPAPAPVGRATGPHLSLPDLPSVAVLPFDNAASDPEQDYFCAGVVDQITMQLSKFGSLFVIAPESASSYRAREVSIQTIGRELGVHYVVKGAIRRTIEHLRISARLIDAQTGNTVWAHHYERPPSEVFELQDRVTEEIVATLAGRVEAARRLQARRTPTANLAAYDCLLRGKDLHHRWTLEDNTKAIEIFRKAAALDPNYAAARAWVGCALGQRYYFTADVELPRDAVGEFKRALEIDDTESECHRMITSYYAGVRDYERAEHHIGRALELNPNDDRAIVQRAELCVWRGRHAEGEALVRKAVRLNPFHADHAWFPLGQALFHLRRYEEAVATLLRIQRPGQRHLALLLASAQRASRPDLVDRHSCELAEARPAITTKDLTTATPLEAIGHTLTYESDADRVEVLDALRDAGIA